MGKEIHQEVTLPGRPDEVYAALTDAGRFTAFTGAGSHIDAEAGGEFRCFDGAITGRQIELIPARRIVQAWRVGTWDEGLYSIVCFELYPHGDSTRLVTTHAGFPANQREHLAAGWHQRYWEPLSTYLLTSR